MQDQLNISAAPFMALSVERVLSALESKGYQPDGRILAMNSYENRVYQIGTEAGEKLIAKFYRPNRWTAAQIQEEHDYCFELAEAELPVVCPIKDTTNQSLFYDETLMFSVYPCQGGREPDLEIEENLVTLGRTIGQIHAVGKMRSFTTRPQLTTETFAENIIPIVAETILPDLRPAYESISTQLVDILHQHFDRQQGVDWIRCHGDTHRGNILWRNSAPHFIDFDDARSAPAIQDLWMFVSGEQNEKQHQLDLLLAGYSTFCDFNYQEESLIEPLRTLRMMHYAAWLSSRKEDPAFVQHFPWFNTPRYWGQHIDELKGQMAELEALLHWGNG